MRESQLPDRMQSLSYNWDRSFLQLSFILSEHSYEESCLITYILYYRNRRQFHSLHLHLFICSFEGRICFRTQIRFFSKVFLTFTEINLCFFFFKFCKSNSAIKNDFLLSSAKRGCTWVPSSDVFHANNWDIVMQSIFRAETFRWYSISCDYNSWF